jgi:hypothetical protein
MELARPFLHAGHRRQTVDQLHLSLGGQLQLACFDVTARVLLILGRIDSPLATGRELVARPVLELAINIVEPSWVSQPSGNQTL